MITKNIPPESTCLKNIHSMKSMLIHHPEKFSEQQYRWMINQRKINGLEESGAVFKVNGRWFFDEILMVKWMKSKVQF